MSTTSEEEVQNTIDNEAEVLKEYILSNGEELNSFFMANLVSVENISNLIVQFWNEPELMGRLVRQQIEIDLDQECGDKARERVFG